MCILWRTKEKLTVADIINELDNNDWTSSTVATFMARLLKKGVISCDKKGKVNYYFPVLKQNEYAIDETENLISKIYKGSVKNLVATLYENKKLFNENFNLNDPRYMVFYETYVEFYNPITNQKNEYTYSYNQENQTIIINSEDFFLQNGIYNIKFENEYLKISQSIDGNDYIYYFLSAEG